MQRALIVVAKHPAPTQTKTRLSPPLTGEQAANLYECFLKDTLETARHIPGVDRFLAYAPREQVGYFRALAPDFMLLPQVGRGLGERLDNALRRCLRHGFSRVVIMGSDSPTLPADHIRQTFDLLEDADVVLGKCEDGGYYAIGVKRPHPELLRGVRMSTPTVLRDTLAIAEASGLKVALASEWYDLDRPEDLARLQEELRDRPGETGSHTGECLSTIAANQLHPDDLPRLQRAKL